MDEWMSGGGGKGVLRREGGWGGGCGRGSSVGPSPNIFGYIIIFYIIIIIIGIIIIMPPPTEVEGGIMFSGCPSVRPSVRNPTLLARLRLNGLTDFNQTLHICSVTSVDKLIRFWQGSNQRWLSGGHLFVCLQHKFVSAISSV